ncbi:Non-ribosomal peptide synthetase [Gnomoniopsis sp. IMI 355080]|nr:Non-ribosomal peptide synthetase [Gnomoniopsis sp. IMI 355080]
MAPITRTTPLVLCSQKRAVAKMTPAPSVKAPIVLVSSQHQGLFSRPTLVVDSTLLQQFDYETKDERFTFSSRRPEDTCIVVFSSGSTGVPKGIVHTHQSLATGLVQNGPRHGLDRPGVRVFQWCAYTFDIALSEIWGPLICGGVVCIPSEEERLNDVETPMKRMSVEWAFFTPSFARFFCRQKYSVETLETLVVGGEALTHQDARAFLAKIGLKRVIHLFGPAELITQFLKTLTPHFYNTESPIENGKPDNVSFVPSNAHCWIVDPDDTGRLAPVGAVGELLIEGPALLNGYLNDAARDAIAFVDTPDWRLKLGVEPPVSRIYRSGDLVRYVGNGEIQYVSRKDGVIKLHGQFIDLGEIESVLRASLGQGNACVEMELFETEAAVLPVHNVPAPGDQTLVTFLCVKNNEQALQDRSLVLSTVAPVLQTLLRKKLPEYMIPRLFYLIEHFPYNASGKLDRKALGSLASTFTMADLFQLPSHSNQVQEGQSEVAGESLPSKEGDYVLDEHGYQELSTLLTRAWVDVFGCSIDEVAHQDFFQQGGNSMRAMELVAAARRNGVSISVTKIFRNPEFNRLVSVASLSVKRDESVGDNATVPRFSLIGSIERRDDILNQVMEQCRGLKMSEVQDVLPATPLQSEFMAESLLYPGSFKAQTWFAIPTEVSFESFRTLWQHLIDKFANLRCRIVHTTKYGDMQVVLNTGRSCSWIEADKFSMEEYWLKDRANPMGYGDPLVRYATIGGAEGSNRVVLLTMHQCIFDGFTVKRIEYALGDLVQGKAAATISMPPFASFIKHITTQLDENDAKQFWENYLAGYAIDKPNEPFPSLPTPSYLPRADSLFAANVHFPAMSLAADRRSHITLPTIFLAAWALVINHYTGANDIVFPMHISGRGLPVPKLMEMAFPTIASVPVRIQLPSDVLSLFQHPEESVPVSPQDLALLEGFLQTLQADQIQLATTGFGHIGYDTIATYSDSCSRAIETCKHFPLGNLNIQYAVATWRPRPQDEKDAASAVEAQDQLRLEFQVNRNDAKYFSPGDALTPGCYILNDETARLVMVYDSKVVPDEKLAEYTSKFEEFVRALTTRLTC